MRNFSELLRLTRQNCGRSMGQLARRLNVSVPYVSDVERGNRPPLTNEKILAAAEFLGVDPTDMLAAAAASRGEFTLNVRDASPRKQELGTYLTRGWGDLTDEDAEEIKSILRRRMTK